MLRKFAYVIGYALLSIGIDVRKFLLVALAPKYFRDRWQFTKMGGVVDHTRPILSDWSDEAGSVKDHYFHQDLLVAQFIYEDKPERHIDIGSRLDGFVAHVASFRSIEVIDIRNASDIGHRNIKFTQSDILSSNIKLNASADSVSSLHVIEHFGLGRYGDPIDPNGHRIGLKNIVSILRIGGRAYVSFPIGIKSEVHFNAHRVLHPLEILAWPEVCNCLRLQRFDFVDDSGVLHKNVDLESCMPTVSYGCGIYTFEKIS